MMACGPWCGWCGRCTAPWEYDGPVEVCVICGDQFEPEEDEVVCDACAAKATTTGGDDVDERV